MLAQARRSCCFGQMRVAGVSTDSRTDVSAGASAQDATALCCCLHRLPGCDAGSGVVCCVQVGSRCYCVIIVGVCVVLFTQVAVCADHLKCLCVLVLLRVDCSACVVLMCMGIWVCVPVPCLQLVPTLCVSIAMPPPLSPRSCIHTFLTTTCVPSQQPLFRKGYV